MSALSIAAAVLVAWASLAQDSQAPKPKEAPPVEPESAVPS